MRCLLLALVFSAVVSACGADTREAPPVSRDVTWLEAQHLLKSCRVRNLEQTHSRLVVLRLRSGGTATSHEPTIDDIYKILARLPRDCQPKTVATE